MLSNKTINLLLLGGVVLLVITSFRRYLLYENRDLNLIHKNRFDQKFEYQKVNLFDNLEGNDNKILKLLDKYIMNHGSTNNSMSMDSKSPVPRKFCDRKYIVATYSCPKQVIS